MEKLLKMGWGLVFIVLFFLGNVNAAVKWKFETDLPVKSSPAVAIDGTIYVGSGEGILYAVNPNGTLKWEFATGDSVVSSPAIGRDGTIYFASYDGNFYALSSTGTLKWSFPIGDSRSSPAIAADGTVYIVGSENATLYAFTPTGILKWALPLFNPTEEEGEEWIGASPAIGYDRTIYITTGWPIGKLFAINPNGTIKWSLDLSNPSASSPAIGADGTIYFGTGANDGYGYVYAVNPDGTVKWVFKTNEMQEGVYATAPAFKSSPAIGADGTIYIGCNNGYLYALNPRDGSIKWKFAAGDTIKSSPAVGADGTIYFGSYDGYLYALNPNGTLKWKEQLGEVIKSSPVIDYRGNLYIGVYVARPRKELLRAIEKYGALYAIYTGTRGVSRAPWPMFRHDMLHTARKYTPTGCSLSPERTFAEGAVSIALSLLPLFMLTVYFRTRRANQIV